MNDLTEDQTTTEGRVARMVRLQLAERGIADERVLAAMRAVPRERFVAEEHRGEAYADRPSPIGHGQTISQPFIVGLMSAELAMTGTERVLEIGTGSGYHTAVLARLAGEVYTVERVKPLLDAAWHRLMDLGVRNVKFRHGDGSAGWPAAGPFDRVLIAAGAPRLPTDLLLDALVDGGVAVLPIGTADKQMLVHARRRGYELDVRDLCPCRFVKLIGEHGWGESDKAS